MAGRRLRPLPNIYEQTISQRDPRQYMDVIRLTPVLGGMGPLTATSWDPLFTTFHYRHNIINRDLKDVERVCIVPNVSCSERQYNAACPHMTELRPNGQGSSDTSFRPCD